MIIGIGGASRSGKTSLAHAIKKRNQDLSVAVISQDDYVYPIHQIPKINELTDWECPASINVEKFSQAITFANENYDLTIAEGFLIYHFEDLPTLFDKKIFLEINRSSFLLRKKTDARWGHIPDWYTTHIWESFLQFGQYHDNETLVLDGNAPIDTKALNHQLQLSSRVW